ncbi:MAG: hypothetical protein BWY84_00725 [Candidatus Aerophobetes bacterium ADurb.Bin490]|nr:MAG: hypothetical protein BWY84_00725 [Candidatus Aerophobetes bacterium ADurb.Bin490]HNZ29692.1 hypothetical protein [Candidatus Goldiibacteriota bacterium]HPN63594.1 hypothetical protein [Candidatus Goldiibacteriota bacterium]HRQ42741.1 hypothetical protein [Candidatus Goldiibacteriota bacterium]
MELISFLEQALLKYNLLTGQKKKIFCRIILAISRLKTFNNAPGVINVVYDSKLGIKKVHYNDKIHFEIAFAVLKDGKIVIADFKCLF